MKRFTLLLLALSLLASFSCKKIEDSISVSKETVQVAKTGQSSIKVQVTSNVNWTASSSEEWVSVNPAIGSGDLVVTIKVEANDAEPRTATVTFTTSNTGATATVEISQDGEAPKFAGGKGTESDPYQISKVSEYLNFANLVNGEYSEYGDKCYTLVDDIDFKGVTYVSVGATEAAPFKGKLLGDGHKISNATIHSTGATAYGLFSYMDGATVSNITLTGVDVDNTYAFTGAVAGIAKNSTIENVKVEGKVRAYTSGITVAAADYAPVSTANAGYGGGVVGLSYKSTIKGCSFSGQATFYGKFSGGIVGVSYNSTIENCAFNKECTLNVYYHFNGGVVGRAVGADNLIKGCSFEGNLTCVGYCSGGIVGQLFGGTVDSCVLGSYAYIGGDKYFEGGIVGSAQPMAPITINNCACYGKVQGAYSVGGIVGYVGPGTGASSDKDLCIASASANSKVTISRCATLGAELTATGGNSYGYSIVGGIVGWSHGALPYHVNGCYSLPGLIQTTYGSNKYGVLSGISSYQNSSGGAIIENCYSGFSINNFLVRAAQMTDETMWYAGITIRCTGATELKNCYSMDSMRWSYSNGSTYTESGCASYSVTDMINGTLLAKLNETSNGTEWVKGNVEVLPMAVTGNAFPTIKGLPDDPNVKPKPAKRVSVIGDSISTFKGWIPANYSAHYPAVDGTLTTVNETYWYRLAKDFMKDASIERNIAFSGSTVTNTTAENYAARYGTATNAWWHNSYSERFAACGGCGNPDIILIHGGTNDWSHNADPLAPGVAIRNDESNIYGGTAPSESIMNSIYSTADAATTREAVNALPDGTFCEAYVKLLCQIRERYPQCKVVCVIGDYLSSSIEQSVIHIAQHYGAKTVNLFRVNGFNDLGGYSPETLTGLGKPQPNMPKHDHTDLSSAGGCHPGSECMLFMANKIYTELGTWLEE